MTRHQLANRPKDLGAGAYLSYDRFIVTRPRFSHEAAEIGTLNISMTHRETQIAYHFVEAPPAQATLVVSEKVSPSVRISLLPFKRCCSRLVRNKVMGKLQQLLIVIRLGEAVDGRS